MRKKFTPSFKAQVVRELLREKNAGASVKRVQRRADPVERLEGYGIEGVTQVVRR